MSLFCTTCKTIIVVEKAVGNNCPKCKNPLSELGKEAASISKSYTPGDTVPPKLEGKSGSYTSKKLNLSVLECETTLQQDPHNIPALTHLYTYYLSQNNLNKAEYYATKRCLTEQGHPQHLKDLAQILLKQKSYSLAIETLLELRKLESGNFWVYKNLGVAYYLNKNPSKSRLYFKWAKDFSRDRKQRDEIDNYIDAIKDL